MASIKMPSKEDMRARYWELLDAMDAVRAKVAPLREARDAAVNAAARADEKAMAEIHAIEAKVEPGLAMFEAQNELAALARALGNVGERPGAE